MASDYVPFDATPQEIEARSVLRPGVPDSMRGSLLAWMRTQLIDPFNEVPLDLLRSIENTLDLTFHLPIATHISAKSAMSIIGGTDDRLLLRIADFLIQRLGRRYGTPAQELDRLLLEGRSKWMVGPLPSGAFGLQERVPQGVQDVAEALIAEGGSAGKLLALAGGDVHNIEPHDSAAYSNAVKAVEAAALPVMGLDTGRETLGDVIRTIEGNRTGQESTWRLPFLRERRAAPSQVVLAGMLKSLWRGQRDRHGSGAFEGVTHEEALAAVFMAVTLVGWFSQGLVAERTNVEDYG